MNEVLDTLRIQGSQILYKSEHLERTQEALQFCGSPVSYAELNEYYASLEEKFEQAVIRVIFTHNRLEQTHYEILQLTEVPVPVQLEISQIQIPACRFKWADRSPWQAALAQKSQQADDLLFLTPEGHLRESSRFNIFIYDQQQNCFITPKLTTGCINGVFRRYLLKNKINDHATVEQDIKLADLNLNIHQIFVGNSVRGLLPAKLL